MVCLDCASPEEAPPLKQGKQPCAIFPVDMPYYYCWCVGEQKPSTTWPFNICGPYPRLVSSLYRDKNYDCHNPKPEIWLDMVSSHYFPNIGTIRVKRELR